MPCTSNPPTACGTSDPTTRRPAPRTPARRLPLLILLLGLTGSVDAAWDEKQFNPKPADGDILLPMPCDGKMAFRKISVPLASPLDDYAITVGQDSRDWGYLEQARPAHIAGSFTTGKPQPGRYYLLAKYELSALQYQAVMADTCPTPATPLRLPQTQLSWFDAVAFADRYNQWLQKNAASALPREDGIPGFVRLPTEVEWEFAARGGIAVSPAEFRDLNFPMPDGLNGYAWFAGPQSANNKLQLTGLLQPNPQGLHDLLGNVAEMVFEPFRLNKLDRLHGQAGGFIVRGGHYQTPPAELRSALRQEEPYYTNGGPNRTKTTGLRLALVAPALTSRARIQQIEKDWAKLGATPTAGSRQDPVKQLDSITSGVQDDTLKQQLETLQGDLRANIQARDEQRDQAIRASLQLGAFLCTKLQDDGKFYDFLVKHHQSNCQGSGATSESCAVRQQKVDDHKKVLDFLLNYYADTLVDAASTYTDEQIEPQIDVSSQQLAARGKNNLRAFLDAHWNNLNGHLQNGKIARQQWLDTCKNTGQ